MDGEKLAGYFSFLLYDKFDKKNNRFELTFMDDNLNVAKKVDVIRPKDDVLLETAFNGSHFLCVFYGDDKLNFVTYDKSGKQTGNVTEENISKYEKARIQMGLANPDAMGTTVFPLGDRGFVRQTYAKNEKLGYFVGAYDNTLRNIWSYASDVKSDSVEIAQIISTGKDYTGIQVMKKKNMMTKNMDSYLALIENATGKVMFNKPLKDENNELSLLEMFVEDDGKSVILFGEYYPKGEEITKSKSEGVYVVLADLSGNMLKKSRNKWADIRAKRVAQTGDLTEDEKEATRPVFHFIHRSKDGRIVAIGEQYKKAASAMGIASNVMNRGSGASNAQLNIMNMVAIELDKDLNLSKYYVYKKKKTVADLPPGSEYMSSTMIAAYVKSTGGFDYNFTSTDRKKDTFVSIYQDYDRKSDDDGKKSDVMLGAIKFDGNTLTNERIPINTNAKYFQIYPAKPGYVVISEWYKKTKTLTMRMEKVVY